jgi:drug/metabolite transporter (DMT)-like permease
VGYVYALLAALLFGANGSVTKVILSNGFTPAQVTVLRVVGTAVIAGAILAFCARAAFRVSWRQLAVLATLGVTGVAILQFAYAVAITLLPVGITLLFEYLAVLLVALVAFFLFKENVKLRLWIAIIFVLLGLALVAEVWDSTLGPLGVVAALVSAVALTVYFVVGEREVGKATPMTVLFWTMAFASVFWMLFGDWRQLDPAIFGSSTSLGGHLAGISMPFWVLIAWNILLGSFIPYLFSFLALRTLSATAAGIVASAEVVFAFAVAWLWLGESLNLIQIMGGSVVLVGIVLAQTARANKVVQADLVLVDTAAITLP